MGADVLPPIRWAIQMWIHLVDSVSLYTGISLPILGALNLPFSWLLIGCIILGLCIHVLNWMSGDFLGILRHNIVFDLSQRGYFPERKNGKGEN